MRLRKLFLLALLPACNPQIYSPPANFVHSGPAETVEQGKHELNVGGAVAGASDLDFGVAHAGYRYGVVDGTEVSVAGQLLVPVPPDSNAQLTEPFGGAAVGFKQELGTEWVAASGSVGAGASPFGTYLASDLGLHVSYPNAYVVPFLTGRAGLSTPLAKKTVTLYTDGDDTMTSPEFHQADTTFLFSVTLGGRVLMESMTGWPLYIEPSAMLGKLYSSESDLAEPGETGILARNDGFFAFSLGLGTTF
ncbi:MAG: hypothetical protein KC416_06035 [Myxococcales bacterium]|nr:hypothetical protein [Myxococcales bacterium]